MIRRPAAILALLTALNFLNYIDRYVLSTVLPLVEVELGLSNFVAGTLATVFLVGYFATSPFFGQLGDREGVPGGRKGLLAAGVGVWSLATFASGLARGAGSLAAARALVGVGEASYGTIAPTIIDDLAPPQKKGRWFSIFYLGITVGSALGFVIGGVVQKFVGWRATFFVVGGPGILAALLCLAMVEPARKGLAARPELLRSAVRLAKIPLYRRSILGYCAATFAMGGFGYWAPTFLLRRYELPLAKGSGTFGIILVLGGGIGTLLGGWLADTWSARAARRAHELHPYRETDEAPPDPHLTARIELRVCALGSLIAAPLAVGCFLAPSPTVFFILGFFCEVFLFLSTAPVNTVALRTVPTELRASSMALAIFAIHFLGDLWSPPLLGLLQDLFPIAPAMMLIPAAVAVSAALWWPWTGAPTTAAAQD